MSDAFNSSPAQVGNLLSTNSLSRERIVIPKFQRGYMWKAKHVEAFWEDVDKQRLLTKPTKGADPHFFGPIVTLSSPTDGILWLLDGQQRLATATILFSVIRDVAREISKLTGTQAGGDFAANLQSGFIRDEDGNYSIEMGETDHLYFKDTIQSDPPLQSKAKQLTHRNIRTTQTTLRDKVKSVIGPVSPQMDSIQAISVLKEIKQTIISDLITARIPVNSEQAAFKIFATLNDRGLRLSPPDLLLSYLMEKSNPAERKDIRSTWTQMIQKMGTHDIHDFLRAMWVSRYGDLKKDDLFTALKNHIEKNKISSLDFARDCGDECDEYIQLATADETQLPINALPFVRALTRELGFKPALPLLLSSYLSLQPNDFEKVAKYILVFYTRYSIIGNKDSSGMENLLFKLAREIRAMTKGQNGNAISQQVAAHVKSSLSNETPDDPATEKSAEDVTMDASDAKYVLTRVANYKQDQQKQIILGETNLEHIYPQSPEPNDWGGQSNQEKLEPLTWHIGNLTIFGKKANRKAANAEFQEKQHRYALSKVLMTSEIASNYAQWDESTIKDRARKLAKLIVQVWRFDNPSRV